jgi:hypothetical protein
VSVEEGGVAVVTFDCPGEKVNTLNEAVMRDILPVMDRLGALFFPARAEER